MFGQSGGDFNQVWKSFEIVQPQMTKTKMLTGRGGGDHIADLHLLVGALPHMESDFAFFTKHPLCRSCLRFQPTYQFPNFPSPKRPKAPRMRGKSQISVKPTGRK